MCLSPWLTFGLTYEFSWNLVNHTNTEVIWTSEVGATPAELNVGHSNSVRQKSSKNMKLFLCIFLWNLKQCGSCMKFIFSFQYNGGTNTLFELGMWNFVMLIIDIYLPIIFVSNVLMSININIVMLWNFKITSNNLLLVWLYIIENYSKKGSTIIFNY
jgi:hypothetical protein